MEERKLTGYPSIDRPQTQYYRKAPIRNICPEQTVYSLVFNSNKGNMSDIALEYLGTTWSFRRLKKTTDRAATAFAQYGIKMGDVVLVGVSNTPEAVVTLLALNKIGAISKWFDIRASEKDIEKSAMESGCKMLVAFDMLIPRIVPILDKTLLENVVIINPAGSIPMFFRFAYLAKSSTGLPKDPRFIAFEDFLKKGFAGSTSECVPFDKERPSIMIQSSGTTGKPKTIVHSDYSATACVQKIAYSDLPLGRKKKLLCYLPPWIAYALGDTIILGMALGTTVVLSPTFEPDKFANFLGNFSICFTAPICYRYLKDHIDQLTPKQKNGLHKVECLVSGGDKITAAENAELERVLGTVVINGYGNNEGWGALSVNPARHNKYGTVGIPKYGETIIAYDNENNAELKYGVSGELCVLSDTLFLEYEANLSETNAVKRLHEDGNLWLHTGDLGFVDQDGFITLNGRIRRVIVRRAFKISAYTIENAICRHPLVKECVTVEVQDSVEEHVPLAYIVLKENVKNVEAAIDSIEHACCQELKDYEVPKYFLPIESLPYTQNGKYDFRVLEKMGAKYVESLPNGRDHQKKE